MDQRCIDSMACAEQFYGCKITADLRGLVLFGYSVRQSRTLRLFEQQFYECRRVDVVHTNRSSRNSPSC